ncbi:LOW QUALITY PROTEIN: hypothetical protein HID58_057310 [Brassica napus]|uniref:Replication factor A C-terminal domain-containing protein n=1 Tax=Brassica napus TaxID=3708 RepID=A0ABQ8AQR8_BRANA|nr:LOW QUALITY PROTEIN: hypothetical protein HID58_057310 [Brassica napus]
MKSTVVVYLSLWDEAAATFRGLLSSGNKTQSVNPKIIEFPYLFYLIPESGKLAYAGYLYLNSTPASKFYFDRNIPAIEEFTSRCSSRGIPCIDTMEGIKKKELVSIGDLNTFISNSSDQQRKPISYVKLWSLGYSNKMVGHTGCGMKLDKSGTSLRCNRCVSTNITGVIRFRVELADDDGNDCATFCDREMSKHTEQEADTLALDEISGGEGQELPRCLEELAGKDYVFQIRVTPYSFTPNHRTFTVSAISDASSFCTHAHAEIFENTCTTVSQSCTSNPTAVIDGEDGQLTASASNLVERAKIAMGVDCRERKQPQNAPVNDSFKSIILSTPLTFHQTTSHAEDRDFDFI